jgi:hypothetical protein
MVTDQDSLQKFLSLSIYLTGFDKPELLGTGLAKEDYQPVISAVGEAIKQKLCRSPGLWPSISSTI